VTKKMPIRLSSEGTRATPKTGLEDEGILSGGGGLGTRRTSKIREL